MARFFLEVPHTAEDCVREIDSVMGHSHELFARFDWGCKGGEHVGWVFLEAQDAGIAKMMLPALLRARARVVGANKFTIEDVASFHAEPPKI